MCLTHYGLIQMMNNDVRLRRRNVGRFRYKLYAPTSIHIEVQNGYIGCWLFNRFYTMGAFLISIRRLFIFARKIGISDMRRTASWMFD